MQSFNQSYHKSWPFAALLAVSVAFMASGRPAIAQTASSPPGDTPLRGGRLSRHVGADVPRSLETVTLNDYHRTKDYSQACQAASLGGFDQVEVTETSPSGGPWKMDAFFDYLNDWRLQGLVTLDLDQPAPTSLSQHLADREYRALQIEIQRCRTQQGFAGILVKSWNDDELESQEEISARYREYTTGLQEVDPHAAFSSWDYGTLSSLAGMSSPIGDTKGIISAPSIFENLPVLMTTVDGDDHGYGEGVFASVRASAQIDRLKSYAPDRPLWANLPAVTSERERERDMALVLTRGVQSIGIRSPDFNAGDDGDTRSWQSMTGWTHRFGGVFNVTTLTPSVGILYLQAPDIANSANKQVATVKTNDMAVTDALFLCQAAGWPAQVITPEAISRKLPASMQAILVVGAPRQQPPWQWYKSLEPALTDFVNRGGIVVTDQTSDVPVPHVELGQSIVTPATDDPTQWGKNLLMANQPFGNALKSALSKLEPPIASCGDPRFWTVASRAGDTQYVTVLDEERAPQIGDVASSGPKVASVSWHTDRPIYSLRAQKATTVGQEAQVDLTEHSFQLYALPPHAVTAPHIDVALGAGGMYETRVTVGDGTGMTGIPVAVTVSRGDDNATVYGITGLPVRIPLAATDEPGDYTVGAQELLSGLAGTTKLTVAAVTAPQATPQTLMPGDGTVARFAARASTPLEVAVTDTQASDKRYSALADQLVAGFAACGRTAKVVPISTVSPAAVSADLVLLGSAKENRLIRYENSEQILPVTFTALPASRGAAFVTFSPFSARFEVLNIFGQTYSALADGVAHVVSALR